MNKKVKQFWNSSEAEGFEKITIESGRYDAIEDIAKVFSLEARKPISSSLDLGCGTGLFEKALDRKDIIGVDISSPFLELAKTRINKIIEKSIFEYKPKTKFHNIISLFVIDDYSDKFKKDFLKHIISLLKPSGKLFFAAYSPNDERMGSKKDKINKILNQEFNIELESLEFYENIIKKTGLKILTSKFISKKGLYKDINVNREFIFIIAELNKS
jgi:2-polyprenyl-3-methyl-5-hydroxy-6-metoxy-1,4-benzoquinol methylase